MRMKWGTTGLILVAINLGAAMGQTAAVPRPASRIVQAIDSTRLVTLRGNTHPNARAAFDRGQVDDLLAMNRIVMTLGRSAEQEAELTQLMADQYDPKSPNFHHWLSAQEFGLRFGPSDDDVAKVSAWLASQGFTVDKVAVGRTTIEFSGNAGQVRRAFHTEIHHYTVNGVDHTANDSDPQIPEALAPVVKGVASLHNFFPVSQSHPGRRVKRDLKSGLMTVVAGDAVAKPDFTYTIGTTVQEDVTPFDLATIYNVLPLRATGITGAGVTIAVSGTSDINLNDVATYQSSFGLPNNAPTIVHNGPDPGTDTYYGGASENTMDVEIASAVAPSAKIVLVISKDTQTTSGDLLSDLYIVDNQVGSILTKSYGLCELDLGTAGNAAYNQIFQQGAAEGISIFISAGDSGSAGCESHENYQANPGTTGLQVSGIASSPYVTAVGGTDFSWQSSPSTYWNSTNAANGSTAKGYVPEVSWNSTCTDPYVIALVGATSAEASCKAVATAEPDLLTSVGGSGGVSQCTTPSGTTPASCAGGYAKPSWQVGNGVPADGKRDIPDVSLFASFGIPYVQSSSYLICYSSASHPCNYTVNSYIEYQEDGGTSASAPAMAGVMALVLQKAGSAQGLANPVLYQLAATQNNAACNASTVANGNSCLFYDTTAGNNTTPCKTGTPNCVTTTSGDAYGVLSGYSAGVGYDLTTGLGSMNVTNLVNAWATLVGPPVITVMVAPATLISGQVSVSYSQQLTASGGTQPYTYTVSSGNLPPGLTLNGATGLLSGTPTMANTYPFTITAVDSSAAGPYSGLATYALIIHQSGAVPTITWHPTVTRTGSGNGIGSGTLDATGSVPGSFTYTIPADSLAMPVTASTVLDIGTYTITATFTPTDTVNYTVATATITFTVFAQHVWIANTTGGVVSLDAGGNIYSSASASGGLTIGIGTYGTISSATLSGTSISTFNPTGTLQSTQLGTGGGLNTPSAEVVDAQGFQWFVNANNSVTGYNYGANSPLTPTTGYTGGGMNNPQGVAIDAKGSLWIANAGNNSVTEILGVPFPSPPVVELVVSPTQ
jgi:hypothetical protein